MTLEWSLRAALLVAAGGAVGCLLRYGVGVLLARPGFPWGTLGVNLAGSFVLGVLAFGVLADAPQTRLFLATGLLGGFTTMSSFSVETLALLDVSVGRAAAYAGATFAGSLGTAMLGRLVAQALAS